MTSQELRKLIDAALEGEISEADFLRLEAELSIDAHARSEYYERALLTTLLENEAAENLPGNITLERRRSGLTRSRRNWRMAFLVMASVCAVLIVVMMREGLDSVRIEPASVAAVEQVSSGYAILSGESEAVWENQASLRQGGMLPPGELHLKSGVVQLELFSGVTLVVEGEAKFSILSPMEVSVSSGKVRAQVPEPAQGFRMLTGAGEVVDLGTEFAVDVSDNTAEVYVLDGEIEWLPKGLPTQRLKQGEATRSDGQKQTPLASNSQTFIDASSLQQRIKERQNSRREQWEQASEKLSQDDRMITHYQLESSDVLARRIPNLATQSLKPASEGAVVAAGAAANRWGEPSRALDFSPAGSRVRTQIPGEYQNLSLICWVKINSLDRWYNSLFLTDGHEQGEPHWQIMDDGRLFFSVKKRDQFDRSKGEKDKHVFYSPPFWDPSLSGRWIMIATVYDSEQREVVHYLNGQILSREAVPEEYLVKNIRIGDASLCNWGLPERDQPRFSIRNLNGCLDEFMMFSAPLSEVEIQEIYEISHP
ncbi:MAG: FecR domain-containing protein [Planctomycetaceae bacterium]|nr:FecR domain-containing protein [Planctomycetaceae bacterium]